jgi:hypothetical protein
MLQPGTVQLAVQSWFASHSHGEAAVQPMVRDSRFGAGTSASPPPVPESEPPLELVEPEEEEEVEESSSDLHAPTRTDANARQTTRDRRRSSMSHPLPTAHDAEALVASKRTMEKQRRKGYRPHGGRSMAEEKHESTPTLDDLEDGWGSSAPVKAAEGMEGRSIPPDTSDVDEGWLDELFPEGEEEEAEEEEEPEPELPDERLDPVAYAAAKQARDERAAARRDKKKAKLEAKRARQRARAAEARAKQKGKSKSKPSKSKPRSKAKPAREADASKRELDDDDASEDVAEAADERAEMPRKRPPPMKKLGGKRPIATQWKLLAVAVAVFIAAAAFAAALAR